MTPPTYPLFDWALAHLHAFQVAYACAKDGNDWHEPSITLNMTRPLALYQRAYDPTNPNSALTWVDTYPLAVQLLWTICHAIQGPPRALTETLARQWRATIDDPDGWLNQPLQLSGQALDSSP